MKDEPKFENYRRKLMEAGFDHETSYGQSWSHFYKTIDVSEKQRVDFEVAVTDDHVCLKVFIVFDSSTSQYYKLFEKSIQGHPEPQEILSQLFETTHDMFWPIAVRMSEGMMLNQ